MESNASLRIIKIWRDKTRFTDGKMTITTGQFIYQNGKHHIKEPKTAKAVFACCGERYMFMNEEGITSVEDWYWGELLPKMQMIGLIKSNVAL